MASQLLPNCGQWLLPLLHKLFVCCILCFIVNLSCSDLVFPPFFVLWLLLKSHSGHFKSVISFCCTLCYSLISWFVSLCSFAFWHSTAIVSFVYCFRNEKHPSSHVLDAFDLNRMSCIRFLSPDFLVRDQALATTTNRNQLFILRYNPLPILNIP